MFLHLISSALLALSLAFSTSLMAMGVGDASYLVTQSDAMTYTVETNTELIGLSPATPLEDSLTTYSNAKYSPGLSCVPTGGVCQLASGKPSAVVGIDTLSIISYKPMLPT